MGSILSLLLVLIVSIVVTRIATIALTHTGLSRESARFQARSALTGVGFTTNEAETVVNHPVRRRILMMLMLVGNAGIITVIASIFATLVDPADSKEWFSRGLLLVIGLAGLWTAVQSRWLDRQLSRVISRMLSRWTDLNVRDYAGLLHIGGDYQIMEIRVEEDDWMAGQTLAELKLRDEGVVVLGIQAPDGKYMGVPTGKSRLDAGDVMVVYGRGEQLKKLDRRRRGVTGSLEHQDRLVEQKQAEQTEQNEFEESKHAQKR